MHELDMRLEADAMERAEKVGREHEGALENRDDQQILRIGGCDFLGKGLRAPGDRLFVVEDLKAPRPAQNPSSTGIGASEADAKRTITSLASFGGAASLVRKAPRSPGLSLAFKAFAVQT